MKTFKNLIGIQNVAGDWIKLRTCLVDDPRVLRLAELLGEDDSDLMVGKLVRLWTYADQHTVDGVLRGSTAATIDRMLGYPTFCQALAKIGWLELTREGVVIPRFHEHNGSSAKRRAQENQRKHNQRNRKSERDTLRTECGHDADTLRTECGHDADTLRPKRREEKSNTPLTPLGGEGVAETEPQNFDHTAGGLAAQWALCCKRDRKHRVSPDKPEDVLPFFEELLRLGHSPALLLAEIQDPARDRTEYLWQFKNRVTKQAAARQQAADNEAQRRLLETRERFRREDAGLTNAQNLFGVHDERPQSPGPGRTDPPGVSTPG